jgi:hypothetical protein
LFFLKILNYGALILEPLFPLLFILPRGHQVKYLLLLGLVGFHLGIMATLQIPFANVACIAAMVIPFGDELMSRFRQEPLRPHAPRPPARLGLNGIFALLFVTGLTLAMLSSVLLPRWRVPSRRKAAAAPAVRNVLVGRPASEPAASCCAESDLDKGSAEGLEPLQKTFFSFLWAVGIAQQYQLFNWIDERNYYPHYRVLEYEGDTPVREIEPDKIFLQSTRGVLLQFYLHGITWARIPRQREAELRRSLQTRFARRYCQRFLPTGDVAVYTTLERIVPGSDPDEESPVLLMKFGCRDGEPRMQAMNLEP